MPDFFHKMHAMYFNIPAGSFKMYALHIYFNIPAGGFRRDD
jgi:hypothetical protein